MDAQKNAAGLGGGDAALTKYPIEGGHSTPAPQLKWQRVLLSFLTGRSWHTFDATRLLHTTCLHTDVAQLQARGLHFDRERVTVTGYGGAQTSVVRYRLRPESYAHARALLGIADDHQQAESARAYLLASRGVRG